jgi:hypothetical protein
MLHRAKPMVPTHFSAEPGPNPYSQNIDSEISRDLTKN